MPVLAVILHHMPKDGLMANGYHRLRDALGILTYPRAKSATEQNNLHGPKSRSALRTTLGIDVAIVHPLSRREASSPLEFETHLELPLASVSIKWRRRRASAP